MNTKSKIKGWVKTSSKSSQSFAADVVTRSSATLRRRSDEEVAVDAPEKVSRKASLRTEYYRPENGDDSQAKAVLVNEEGTPELAQG